MKSRVHGECVRCSRRIGRVGKGMTRKMLRAAKWSFDELTNTWVCDRCALEDVGKARATSGAR